MIMLPLPARLLLIEPPLQTTLLLRLVLLHVTRDMRRKTIMRRLRALLRLNGLTMT
jgi:hypothetical protein